MIVSELLVGFITYESFTWKTNLEKQNNLKCIKKLDMNLNDSYAVMITNAFPILQINALMTIIDQERFYVESYFQIEFHFQIRSWPGIFVKFVSGPIRNVRTPTRKALVQIGGFNAGRTSWSMNSLI